MFYLKIFAILGFTYFKIMGSSVFAHGYPVVPAPVVESTILVLLLRISCPYMSLFGKPVFFLLIFLPLSRYSSFLISNCIRRQYSCLENPMDGGAW